mgnify:FL=1
MKSLMPAIVQGTHLSPHARTKPKGVVRRAGRRILGNVFSPLAVTSTEEMVIDGKNARIEGGASQLHFGNTISFAL